MNTGKKVPSSYGSRMMLYGLVLFGIGVLTIFSVPIPENYFIQPYQLLHFSGLGFCTFGVIIMIFGLGLVVEHVELDDH